MLRLAALIALFAAANALSAVIVLPSGYPGKVDGALHEVLLVHCSGYQQIALRVTPRITGANHAPGQLVWIIPVIGPRTGFRLADSAPFAQGSDLYDGLYRLARAQWAARTDFNFGDNAEPFESTATSNEAMQAGPATIMASQQKGDAAITEINDWLSGHGYGVLDAKSWSWCGEELSFVWVHAAPGGLHVSLPVVQIGFQTGQAVCPLKYAAEQGDVTLSLSMFSDTPLDFERLTAMRLRLGAVSTERIELHNLWSMQPLPGPIAAMAGDCAPRRWFVNRIHVSGFNKEAAIQKWPDDLTFGLGDMEDELPGFWYYADREISWPEKVFREHALALFIGGSLAVFIVVVLKGRQNRRRLGGTEHHVADSTGSAGPTGPSSRR